MVFLEPSHVRMLLDVVITNSGYMVSLLSVDFVSNVSVGGHNDRIVVMACARACIASLML